jgi:rRNA biogenesis protein RRP5
VSLRPSRIEGNLEDDSEPAVGDIVRAYVEKTNSKGCFVRLSRKIQGRTIIKELCDGFLPNPAKSFPVGRLVVGKVKKINTKTESKKRQGTTIVDLDLRESSLSTDDKQLGYEDIDIGGKYRGSIQRIEEYGVFVRINNTVITGLAHKSECSDSYVKSIQDLFDKGDLVKVLILKKDDDKKQVSLSLKASHFEGDLDSHSGDSSDDEDDSDSDEEKGDLENESEEVDSDDENFVEKLVSKIKKQEPMDDESEPEAEVEGSEMDDEGSENDDEESSESSHNDSNEDEKHGLDTDVGFDWEGESNVKSDTMEGPDDDTSDDDEDENEADDDDTKKTSHKSRKKQAQRRREEQDISRREIALADGTADENPETADDFERLLAGEPNSSEIWIRYMAFHLTLANIQAAREVANRAITRIDFSQEREKLNVWCALFTLELKYGSEESFHIEIDRACQNSNPKQIYLRVCEICGREAILSSPDALAKADELYTKMCRKFKDKKKVWIAHIEYLLKTERQEEAYALSKRALLSLPTYKHVETMSKFSQLMFEFGQTDRARTLFDGLIQKYPKRLDLFFVYVDKEIKHGDVEVARSLFGRVANADDGRLSLKLTDKQMKSFFKKWYSFEEEHGTSETQDMVKDAARKFVEQIAK